MSKLTHTFKRLIRKIGYDVSRFSPTTNSLARRKELFNSLQIDVLLDVGANNGQFAEEMRKDIGFSGRIISFEPLTSAFKKLRLNAAYDSRWDVINCALGQDDKMMEINIAGNSDSSSLLNILPAHIQAAPESDYIAKETVEVKRLDTIINELCTKKDKIYLKIDTQGYESKVIKGAEESLFRIPTIQLEMSLVPLYDEQLLFGEMHDILTSKGYCLISIEPGFTDTQSGRLLQIDGIYHRI